MTEKSKTQTAKSSKDDDALIAEAVAEGQAAISNGETKIAAAMVIYRKLEALDQETVVQALIDGASLTPKGALTYWYNCRRKLAKERRETARE